MRKDAEDKNDDQNQAQGKGIFDSILGAKEEAQRPKSIFDTVIAATDAAERQREEESRPKGIMDSVIAAGESARTGQSGSTDSGVTGQSGGVSSSDGGYSTSEPSMNTTSPSFDELYPPYTGGDEEFVGSGGVGSADYMDALRRGHEAASDEYASDLRSADDVDRSAS